MRAFRTIRYAVLLAIPFVIAAGFVRTDANRNEILNGAWQLKTDSAEQVLIFQDNYCTHTDYNMAYREFHYTRGGRFSLQNDSLLIATEFHSSSPEEVGKRLIAKISFSNGELTTDWNGTKQVWVRIDRGGNPLSGCWRINGRMQGNEMVKIPERARKTIKILSGTRFQWAAINTETKEFFGTGGGTYTFANGKYTENIEFFSRDSSRVGAKLAFDGKLENGLWLHSGLSSKGEPVKETWTRHQ